MPRSPRSQGSFMVSGPDAEPRMMPASQDYEQCIRLAVSLGGDADTLATIAGAIAGAWYSGVPDSIAAPTRAMPTGESLEIIDRFGVRFSGA